MKLKTLLLISIVGIGLNACHSNQNIVKDNPLNPTTQSQPAKFQKERLCNLMTFFIMKNMPTFNVVRYISQFALPFTKMDKLLKRLSTINTKALAY
ncbi:hypothetical protein [Moraxella caprae]|uniref:hypothetical protein n=1 Tax=Moraxella caprae TaxID=90240 RepID=UPI00048A47D9|nr:hypothetical protein [Moraxella caprae]